MAKRLKMILSVTAALIVIVAVVWFSGIIPKQIGRISAYNYVKTNYFDMNLKYEKMEYSSAHGDYFAIFIDSEGKLYNFLMYSKYLPTRVLFDPIKNPAE